MECLLKEKDITSEGKHDALQYASEKGHTACVKLLLEIRDIDVNATDFSGLAKALKLAIKSGNEECTILLFEYLRNKGHGQYNPDQQDVQSTVESHPKYLLYMKLTKDDIQVIIEKLRTIKGTEHRIELLMVLTKEGVCDISYTEEKSVVPNTEKTAFKPIIQFQGEFQGEFQRERIDEAFSIEISLKPCIFYYLAKLTASEPNSLYELSRNQLINNVKAVPDTNKTVVASIANNLPEHIIWDIEHPPTIQNITDRIQVFNKARTRLKK